MITGFHNKENYKLCCFYNRFKFFNDKVKNSKDPKLIICTGIDYLYDFYSAFVINKGESIINKELIPILSKKGKSYDKYFYWILDGKNLILIVPFFTGRNGLNSNEIIEKLADRIIKLLKANNINI
jgi:hypothetical protein